MARLLIILLWGLLLYLLWALLFPAPRRRPRGSRDGVIDTMVRDPHCGTFVPRAGALRKRIRGEIRYFCSRKCLEEYRKKGKP